jgi:hypothetical protein
MAMTPDELRAIMEYLRQRVRVAAGSGEGEIVIEFDAPSADAMSRVGLNAEGAARLLAAPWWDEMVEDIVDTPEMCEPDDSAEQVLAYARDVVSEYIRKRAEL